MWLMKELLLFQHQKQKNIYENIIVNTIKSNDIVARGCAFHIPFQNNSIQKCICYIMTNQAATGCK